MHKEFFIVLPINDTDYRFEIQFSNECSSQCFVTISFFSMDKTWIKVFEKEEMLDTLSYWHFKRRELSTSILEKEFIISQYIKKQEALV